MMSRLKDKGFTVSDIQNKFKSIPFAESTKKAILKMQQSTNAKQIIISDANTLFIKVTHLNRVFLIEKFINS